MLDRIIAIDWSGNRTAAGQRRHIWMAEWRSGSVTLTSGRTRQQTVDAVVAASQETPALVAGFDFAFAFPAWFAQACNAADAPAMWRHVAENGEEWLRACSAPFWGRPHTTCPLDHREPARRGYRATEQDAFRRTGRWPTSAFQIGGAGAVGTGSVRGMPCLLDLQQEGFSIWPFDAPRLPMAVEIYPRIFAGRTRVSDAASRALHLEGADFANMPPAVLDAARASADAFDALCALVGMVAHADELAALPERPERALEGEIWMPRGMRDAGAAPREM